jgi:hypothetical protein
LNPFLAKDCLCLRKALNPFLAERTSVNRIIRCYRNKGSYYGNDKGEIWGERREAKYQEIKESIKKAKHNIQK